MTYKSDSMTDRAYGPRYKVQIKSGGDWIEDSSDGKVRDEASAEARLSLLKQRMPGAEFRIVRIQEIAGN